MELFNVNADKNQKIKPLSERCRPCSFEQFIDQDHLVDNKGLIHSMLISGHLRSLILWGPPGSGKTTLAHLIGKESNAEFVLLNAISSGVKEVRKVIESAKIKSKQYGEQLILFIDEIHRFNKNQQDSLLYAVEKGEVILIGATTENPSFEVNPPLLSRCKVLRLNSISEAGVKKIINNAISSDSYLKTIPLKIDEKAMTILIQWSNGDARIALNMIESAIAISLSVQSENKEHIITPQLIEQATQKKMTRYDKKGDYHYDVISAFIKSVRGSDPDAALYYLAVMLEGGEDIEFIGRRLVILASEDVGNADPQGLVIAVSCLTAIKNIGMPEARIVLAQATTYLASAPKSNASYRGIENSLNSVKKEGCEVPHHLRNAPTKLMKEMGYSKNYRYPHNAENHFIKENYLPDKLKGKQFYFPTEQGFEKKISLRLAQLWGERK